MRYRLVSAIAVLALGALASAQDIYMQGLVNPRGMAFAPDGTLYVTEAGVGGGSTAPSAPGGPSTGYFGSTGAVSARKGAEAQQKVLQRLPSLANAAGGEAVGPLDIHPTASGDLAVLFGYGSAPSLRSTLGSAASMMGTLTFYNPSAASWTLGTDYAILEDVQNPDNGEKNADPYGLVFNGAGYAVADAGANAVWLNGNGTPIPGQTVPSPFGGTMFQQSVPTSIVAAPGGGYLVGELGGFPFATGKSRILEFGADGSLLGTFKSGFSSIIDMAYAPDGSLLVLELAEQGLFIGGPGDLKRIQPNGAVDTLISGLTSPTSVAFGPDGLIYVTDDGESLQNGLVRRYSYQPVPEPGTWAALALGGLALVRRRRSPRV